MMLNWNFKNALKKNDFFHYLIAVIYQLKDCKLKYANSTFHIFLTEQFELYTYYFSFFMDEASFI